MTPIGTEPQTAGRVAQRLIDLGCRLPDPPAAAGLYVPAVRSGALVHTSGQLPLASHGLLAVGRVGAEVSAEQAAQLAKACAVNALSAISTVANLDAITRILKMTVFVASAPGFNAQAQVANGASELLLELFGQMGKHTRSAVGVAELPLGAPVEVELTVELATR
ncbi:MAG: RidA family protein [Comamonadaceae bacterium]|nr:MAG: RidA family protein [Comamonadaceae bacterium]